MNEKYCKQCKAYENKDNLIHFNLVGSHLLNQKLPLMNQKKKKNPYNMVLHCWGYAKKNLPENIPNNNTI